MLSFINKQIYMGIHCNSFVKTCLHYIYNRIIPYFNGNRPSRYDPTRIKFLKTKTYSKKLKDLKIACICDEITYQCLSGECSTMFVSPRNWIEVFCNFQPDLLFCESAWSGIDKYKGCWRGRIYKIQGLKFENRKELLNILDFCRRSNIKTVFWNKEDPVFFENPNYDFVDTALKFDYIFTTAQECVDKYKKLGHQKVGTLMFGFSPKLFNPVKSEKNIHSAIFAGSWYSEHSKRCSDMEGIFQMVLNRDIGLQICDRYNKTNNPAHRFPSRYKKYIEEPVEFNKLSEIIKNHQYAININTVTDSETMFARRVFEIMACNVCLISNDSVGLRKMFGNHIWFMGEDFDFNNTDEICHQNVGTVFNGHTYKKRLEQICSQAGIPVMGDENICLMIYSKETPECCKIHYSHINYKNKVGGFYRSGSVYLFESGVVCSIENLKNFFTNSFFMPVNVHSQCSLDISIMINHFSYIDENTGIREGKPYFTFVNDLNNDDAVFHIGMAEQVLSNSSQPVKKYLI